MIYYNTSCTNKLAFRLYYNPSRIEAHRRFAITVAIKISNVF